MPVIHITNQLSLHELAGERNSKSTGQEPVFCLHDYSVWLRRTTSFSLYSDSYLQDHGCVVDFCVVPNGTVVLFELHYPVSSIGKGKYAVISPISETTRAFRIPGQSCCIGTRADSDNLRNVSVCFSSTATRHFNLTRLPFQSRNLAIEINDDVISANQQDQRFHGGKWWNGSLLVRWEWQQLSSRVELCLLLVIWYGLIR